MGGGKKFFPYPHELLIWAYTENLDKIGFVVEAPDELCGTSGHGRAQESMGHESIGRSGLQLGALKA